MEKCFILLTLLLSLMIESSEMKCNEPTSSDIEGPFYYPNPPHQRLFCRYKKQNAPLYVFGVVFAQDCKTPLRGVKVEMWQADHDGEYRNETKCRGYVTTNKNGIYKLKTIYPGKYTMSEFESDFRPAHLHFKINGKKGHKTLITQMYFADDKHLGQNDACDGCSSDRKELIVKPKRVCTRKTKCVDIAEFNITLSKGTGVHVSEAISEKDKFIMLNEL
ncbi:Hypothetical predicted protein [Mytilus galloprovincialis]|uniref:Intradiol ring-cleavage dioxygenases domain-containing protein n=2 Tax=Mytilus galloprovincialis TaxID=29158 RepID=A0A8B6CKJ8_MYTGA|nr:Hypothetical predicted protein [Mytilus galloprovincialis]